MQARRLALGCCLHARLGAQALWITDTDVVSLIGQKVVGQSLVSRADAARQLATAQRARMLQLWLPAPLPGRPWPLQFRRQDRPWRRGYSFFEKQALALSFVEPNPARGKVDWREFT